MRRILGYKNVILTYGEPPPLGCRLCFMGLKSVIFVTGLCNKKCFYCPISRERMGKDTVYVNEERVSSIDEVLLEIERSGSTSASITGGEPLLKLDRVLEYIEVLKSVFGEKFHIHLYTNGILATPWVLSRLDKAGLDEIRFHILDIELLSRVEYAVKSTSMSVGIEIPVIPGYTLQLYKLIKEACKIGCKFINLNELEATDSNYSELLSKGFKVSSNGYSVKGSFEDALKILNKALEDKLDVTIHYCPASYKNFIQVRMRFMNTVRNDLRVYEKVVDDYMVEYVEVSCKNYADVKELVDKGIIIPDKGRLYTHPLNATLVYSNCRSCSLKLIKAHPSRSRFVIEYSFLNPSYTVVEPS